MLDLNFMKLSRYSLLILGSPVELVPRPQGFVIYLAQEKPICVRGNYRVAFDVARDVVKRRHTSDLVVALPEIQVP